MLKRKRKDGERVAKFICDADVGKSYLDAQISACNSTGDTAGATAYKRCRECFIDGTSENSSAMSEEAIRTAEKLARVESDGDDSFTQRDTMKTAREPARDGHRPGSRSKR